MEYILDVFVKKYKNIKFATDDELKLLMFKYDLKIVKNQSGHGLKVGSYIKKPKTYKEFSECIQARRIGQNSTNLIEGGFTIRPSIDNPNNYGIGYYDIAITLPESVEEITRTCIFLKNRLEEISTTLRDLISLEEEKLQFLSALEFRELDLDTFNTFKALRSNSIVSKGLNDKDIYNIAKKISSSKESLDNLVNKVNSDKAAEEVGEPLRDEL